MPEQPTPKSWQQQSWISVRALMVIVLDPRHGRKA
jgi:hypothetical protein